MNRYNEKKPQGGRNASGSDSSKDKSPSSQPQAGEGPANRKSSQAGSFQREDQPSEQGQKQSDAGEGEGNQANQSIPGERRAAGRTEPGEPSEGKRAAGATESLEGNDESDTVEADKSQRLDEAFEDSERNV